MLSLRQTTILAVLLFTLLTTLPAEADDVASYAFQNKSRKSEHLHELIRTFASENACMPMNPTSSLLHIIPWGFDSIFEFDMKVFSALTLDTGHEEVGIVDSNESIRMRPICNAMLWLMKWIIINEENSLKENHTYDKGGHDEPVTDRMLSLQKGIVILRGFMTLVLCYKIGVIAYIVVCRIIAFMRYLHRVRTSKDLLKKLPIHKYKTGDPYDVCAICLAEYEEGDKLRVLPCSHAYHRECVDHWLTNKKKTCPFCIQKVENKM